MIKNIISKLTFDDIADNTNLPVTYKDNNKYSSLIWNTYSTAKITHSNNVNVLNITSVNIRILSNTFTTDKPFRINDFELDINISFNTLNSNNNFFGITSGSSNWIYFNVRNTFIGGLSIVSSANKSMQFNYKFESNKDYNIIVSSIDNKYRLIINGETIGFIDSSLFISSLPANSNVMAVVGSGNNITSQNDNMANGKIWNVNISYGAGVKNEDSTHLTKYGSNLLSRLNFDNIQQSTSVNIFTPSLEALINSKVNWEYDNSKLTDYYVNTTFKTNLSTDFTLLLKMSNNRKNIDTKLIEYGNYKVIYKYIGVPEPEVIVTDKTTSALDFEDGIIDKVGTTIWQKEGTADVTNTNKIYGNSSFETKALGDSLYTNSNIITGGSTPFTIEFYCLLIELPSNIWNFLYSKNNNNDNSDYGIFIKNNILSFVESATAKYANKKIYVNDINKYSITYDGVALRIFVNDDLELVIGTPNGFVTYTQPLRFLGYKIPSLTQYNSTTKGIIDNINIYDGIATKVRDYDPYEEFLVADLAFDGENNSTKIVDNSSIYKVKEDKYNDYVVSLLHFDGNIDDEVSNVWNSNNSYYSINSSEILLNNTNLVLNGDSQIYNTSLPQLGNEYTIECFIKHPSSSSTSTRWEGIFSTNNNSGLFFNTYNELTLYISSAKASAVISHDNVHHIALVTKNGNTNVFVDGILTLSSNSVLDATTSLYIGSGVNREYYTGRIDEFRITKGVARYTENFIPPTEPFKYIKVNNWAVNGNAKISTDQKFDGFSSLYLQNTTDYIAANTNTFNFGKSDFTLSFNIIRLSDIKFDVILTHDKDANESSFDNLSLLGIYPSTDSTYPNKLYLLGQKNINGERTGYISNNGLSANTNYKIDLIVKDETLYFYINNKLDSAHILVNNIDFSRNSIVYLGYSSWDIPSSFNGYIKNFKIYKDVAVIPESPTGKIQLDFDNNLNDKYNNSTWTNNGVTFDQLNSVKGYSAKLISSSLIKTSNDNLNFEDKNFSVNFDYKSSNVSSGGRYIFTNNINNTVAGSMWFNSSSNTFFDYVDKPANTSGLALPISQNISNVYYNTNISRNSGVLTLKFNDVIVGMNNLTSQKFNFNGGDSFSLGRNTNFGGGTSFEGYVDNFNSYKEDLLKNNITIYKSPNVNMIVKNESVYTSYNGTPTGSSYGTMVFDDCPIISNFIAELEIFIKSDTNNHGILNFRTTDYSLNSMDNFGYSAYISGSNIKFGKGSNGINASWSEIATLVIPSKFQNDDYHTMKVVANGSNFKIFLDDELMHDVTDTTYNEATKLGWCTYLVNGWNGVSSRIKSLKISNLSGNELYYKDFKSKIENTIDRPAVHLPLETNSINTGFAALTINSVGSPTYTVVNNKKCIKFEQGKYLSINSNNIFNLGTSSDFYIEFDYYITEFKNQVIFCSASTVTTSNLFTITTSSDTQTISKKIYMYVNNRTLFYSDYEYSINAWNNIKVYRKNNTLTISLNGFETSTYINENVDFSFNGTFLGSNNYSQSSRSSDYMSNFKMFVGTSEPPETYNDKKVLNLDFKPTRKSYLFKDNNNKCVIHPVNITQRDYQDSQYCCSFNGVDQYLQLGKNDLLNFGLDDCIIEIFFKPKTQSAEWGTLIGHSMPSATSMDFLMVTRNGTIECRINNLPITTDKNIKVNYNEINKLLFVRNNKNIRILLNDIDIYNAICEEPFNLNKNSNTYIGKNGWDNANGYFCGTIYSIKVLRNTTELTLLDDELDVFNESFKLTNGDETLDQVITNDKKVESHDVRFIKDEESTKLIVDGEFVEVPSVENTTNELILFDNYNSKVKDVKLYNTVFEDDDIFLGSKPIDTEFGEVEYADDEMELFLPEGEFNLIGFIEGYTDRKFSIYNTFYKYELYEGIEDYNITGLDGYSLDDYEIFDLVSGEKYKVLTHEMIKGFISGTVNLKNCGVTSNNMEVFCYRSDNYRHIGTYSVDKDGKYIIPNLDVNSRYDIIFRDKTRKIKDQISNYRQPMKY